MRTSAIVVPVVAIGWVATANAQGACARLKSLKLSATTITQASVVAAGTFTLHAPPFPGAVASNFQLPAHCRVTGIIKPTADSEIHFEVWMPTSGWDERYRQVGNGGLAGNIPYAALVSALQRGAATAGTDDGHVSTQEFDGSWAIGHPEKLIDYGHRAVHRTALAAERIIAAYYGQPARHTYFTGCSNGGREGLMEAERYPQDFEGYLVAEPDIDFSNNKVSHLYVWQVLHALGVQGQLTQTQLRALSAKVLKRCDAVDGIRDGQLRDPRQCPFKVSETLCSSASHNGSCLTTAQATAVQRIYDGARDVVTGAQVTPGDFGTMGTEAMTWPGVFLDSSRGPSLISMTNAGTIAALLYGNPKLNLTTVDIAKAASDAKRSLAPIVNADSPDLRAARRLGRRILQFHGWADASIQPQYSIDYFETVQGFMRSDTSDFYRLFLVPGMANCTGGVGPTSVGGIWHFPVPRDPEHDWVSALEHWVEDGVAPRQMIATEFKPDRRLPPSFSGLPEGTPIKRTRPLCPYPQVSVYNGVGSTDDATNFRCEATSGR